MFTTDISYSLEAFFALVRIAMWFILLFGILAPLFLSHTRKLPIIERLIYSWVGLGGIITVSIMLLSLIHLYDFFSICITLLLIPFVIKIWQSETGVTEYLKRWEQRAVIRQIRYIEGDTKRLWRTALKKLRTTVSAKNIWSSRAVFVLGLAAAGGLIRMYPALINAAPFSRGWFLELDRIKNLRVQDYFSGYPEPGGMHSIVSLFSMLTQVSPELILHLLGALLSFFLCILIYWLGRHLISDKYSWAPIMGVAIYALVPMLFIPISLDQQVEAGSMGLALCFALPTFGIFIKALRQQQPGLWFYVCSGLVAAALTNLFVTLTLLLPSIVGGLALVPAKYGHKSTKKMLMRLGIAIILTAVPFIAGLFYYGIDLESFLLSQFFNIRSYSYHPMLIWPIEKLSKMYVFVAGAVMLVLVGQKFVRHRRIRKEMSFLGIFAAISLLYTPTIRNTISFDVGQLNSFYGILIAIFASIIFAMILEWIDRLGSLKETAVKRLSAGLLVGSLAAVVYLQGGIKVSRLNPSTVPNGFFEAYYKIIDKRLPYSYAIVGPEIERVLSKNRHLFMDYGFFLKNYATIDSVYHQQLKVPYQKRIPHDIPPASIFVFVEKPPFESIQQGILYNAPAVMHELDRWISNYKISGGGEVEVFYSDQATTVYEITNREGESEIERILSNTYSEQ